MKLQTFGEPPALPEAQYADLMCVAFEHCTFRIFFGEEGSRSHRDRLRFGLAVTPPFIKAMVRHLSQNLAAYEAEFGPVPDYYEGTPR